MYRRKSWKTQKRWKGSVLEPEAISRVIPWRALRQRWSEEKSAGGWLDNEDPSMSKKQLAFLGRVRSRDDWPVIIHIFAGLITMVLHLYHCTILPKDSAPTLVLSTVQALSLGPCEHHYSFRYSPHTVFLHSFATAPTSKQSSVPSMPSNHSSAGNVWLACPLTSVTHPYRSISWPARLCQVFSRTLQGSWGPLCFQIFFRVF